MSAQNYWIVKSRLVSCLLGATLAAAAMGEPSFAQQQPADQQQTQPQQQQPPQTPPSQQQPQQPQQPQQQSALTQEQIQQLVAPIALYPDDLLAQVLTASTYPLEVTLAARWSEKNPNVKGDALKAAMEKESWDPSVKGLTAVPQVLSMMNEKLQWTSDLGEAFLAQPDDVQTAVQTLRAKAEQTGNLKSSKEQKVRRVAATPAPDYVGPPEYIVIEPVEPDYIYVPIYDPVLVYGPGFWPAAYVPFFWYPPAWTVGPVFGFGPVLFVGPALWCHYAWGYHGYAAIRVNTTRYAAFNRRPYTGGNTWRFNAAHRRNIAFKNPKLQRQFGKAGTKRPGVQVNRGVQSNKGPQAKGKQLNQVNRAAATSNKNLKRGQSGAGARHVERKTTPRNVQPRPAVQRPPHVQPQTNRGGGQGGKNAQGGKRGKQ